MCFVSLHTRPRSAAENDVVIVVVACYFPSWHSIDLSYVLVEDRQESIASLGVGRRKSSTVGFSGWPCSNFSSANDAAAAKLCRENTPATLAIKDKYTSRSAHQLHMRRRKMIRASCSFWCGHSHWRSLLDDSPPYDSKIFPSTDSSNSGD